MAARALDFFVCGAINGPRLPADGTIPNQFFCVRCDQRALATRKHELWECTGNSLINRTQMKESDHIVTLAQELWDTDQVLFARGLLPPDWLPANELAECTEARMWESSGFNESANNNLMVASDRSGGSLDTPKTLRLSPCKFPATHLSSCNTSVSWEGRCQVDRRFHESSFWEPSKSSAESTKRRTSKFR